MAGSMTPLVKVEVLDEGQNGHYVAVTTRDGTRYYGRKHREGEPYTKNEALSFAVDLLDELWEEE